MFPSGPVTIYRFDSPCGRYCYVGQTQNIRERMQQHRSGDTAISRHCQECHACDRARQYYASSGWTGYFSQLGSATGKKQVDDLEHRYIEVACEEYIRDHNNPFPLNLRAEVGNGILLQAAKKLFEARAALAEKRSRIGPIQSELDNVERERDSLRTERENLRIERNISKAEQDSLEQKLDSVQHELNRTRGELDKVRQDFKGIQQKAIEVEKERDSFKAERDNLKEKSENEENAQEKRNQYRKERNSARQMLGRARKERDALKEERNELKRVQERAKRDFDKLSKRFQELQDRWNREKDAIRAGKLATMLFRVARLAVILALIFALVVILDSGSRAWLGRVAGRVGPALAQLLEDPHQSAAAAQPTGIRQFAAVSPTRATQRPVTHTPPSNVTPFSAPVPQQFTVIESLGANARACPQMDCDVLARLARGSQVTVMDEVQGETYRESALWYRIAWQDGPEEAFVHSSLLGPPTPTPDDG